MVKGLKGSLLTQRDFSALWAGLTVSEVGTQVGQLALPLTAVYTLHAGTLAVGVLRACETLPFLLLGLPAGVWVHSRQRRRVMIAGDLLRMIAFGWVPLAFALGVLGMGQVYAVAAVAGVATVLFDVAYLSYVPRLVPRDRLMEANSTLAFSQSLAEVAGPGLAGVMVRALGAAPAVAVNAASFAASMIGVTAIRQREPPPPAPPERGGGLAMTGEGLRFVFGHPLLRRLAAATATANFGQGMVEAALVVFLARTLKVGPGLIGVVFLLGGAGVVAASAAAGAAGRRLGIGPACLAGLGLAGAAALLTPLAPRAGWGTWMVAAASALTSFGGMIYNVNQLTLRQALCPDSMMSRMNATMRCLTWGSLPLGSLAGGAIGVAAGPRGALWAAAGALLVSGAWLAGREVTAVRDLPGAAPGLLDASAAQ